jgi:hypothetical protein
MAYLEEMEFLSVIAVAQEDRHVILNAPSEPLEEFEITKYVDFIQVLPKLFDFSCLKAIGYEDRFIFQSKLWWKTFPRKYFNSFSTLAHSFYVGTACTYDMYILFEPVEGYCGCIETRQQTSVTKEIAEFIQQHLILGIFKRYYHIDNSMDPMARQTNHLVLTEDFSNFLDHSIWSFEINHLQTEGVMLQMHQLWNEFANNDDLSDKESEFVKEHSPRIVFSNYGQNTQFETALVGDFISSRFDLEQTESICMSLAVNVSKEQKSVVLSETNIKDMFERPTNVEIYRKGFHSQFSNFDCKETIPESLLGLNFTHRQFCRTVVGFHGYSDLANVLRRNVNTEPFAKRPIANLFSTPRVYNGNQERISQFKETITKLENEINVQRRNVIQGIYDKETTGSSYRFEVTVDYKIFVGGQINLLQSNFDDFVTTYTNWVVSVCCPLLSTVETHFYPRIIRMYSESIYKTVQRFVTEYKHNPFGITTWDKEFMAFAECLLLENINGNSKKNLSHRLFTFLGLRLSIKTFNIPYIEEENLMKNRVSFAPNALYANRPSIALQDQQAGVLSTEYSKILSTALMLQMESVTEQTIEVVKTYFFAVLQFLKRDMLTMVQEKSSRKAALGPPIPPSLKLELRTLKVDRFLAYLERNHEHFPKGPVPYTIETLYNMYIGIGEVTVFPVKYFDPKGKRYLVPVLQVFVRNILANKPEGHVREMKMYFKTFLKNVTFLLDINANGWNGKLNEIQHDVNLPLVQRDGRSSRNQRPDLLNLGKKMKSYVPGQAWQQEFKKEFSAAFKIFWEKKLGRTDDYILSNINELSRRYESLILLSMLGSSNQTLLTRLKTPRVRSKWAASFFFKALQYSGFPISDTDPFKKAVQHNGITIKLISGVVPDSPSGCESLWSNMLKAKDSENYFNELFQNVLPE